MSNTGFVYRPRTLDDVQQRQAEINSDSPGVILPQYKVFTTNKGDNWIRILPATWEGARHWAFDVYVHGQVGPDRATVMCNAKMGLGRCPGCEYRLEAERAGDEEGAKALRWRRRAACWLIDRNHEDEGPQIWLMPGMLDEDIQGISIDKTDGQLYLVDDPYGGYDVTFERTGERIATRYPNANLSRRPTSVDPSYLEYIQNNPIPNCLIWRTYEEVKALYEGDGLDGGAPHGAAAPQTQAPARQFGRGPGTRAAPPQALPGRQGPATGYPPSGPPARGPAPPPARRAFGNPNAAPPARMQQAAPPVDNYQGEQYAIDPNYPPPPQNEQEYYGPDPNAPSYYDPNNPYDTSGPANYAPQEEGPPPWNDAPGAINYRNPPQQQYAPPQQQLPPQQYGRPPPTTMAAPSGALPARRPIQQQPPQQQYTQPPQQQYAPPQQQQPPARGTWPGRGAPPAQPQRGPTDARATAEQLRQRYPNQ